MKWTDERPTKPGWYWWRSDTRTLMVVCYVEMSERDGCVSFAYGERYRLLSEMKGQWAGPIMEPEG